MDTRKKNFFQRSAHPYYFRVSEFTHKYAGVRALHYLCHALNEQGYEAWLTRPHAGAVQSLAENTGTHPGNTGKT